MQARGKRLRFSRVLLDIYTGVGPTSDFLLIDGCRSHLQNPKIQYLTRSKSLLSNIQLMSEYSYPTTYSYGGNTSTGSSSRPATLTYPDGSVRESSVPQSLINIEGRPAWADATEEQKALVVKLIRRFLELVYYDARAITDRTVRGDLTTFWCYLN